MKQTKRILLIIALILFVASLFLPAYLGTEGSKDVSGWTAFLFGGFGLLGSFAVGWLANPLALAALVLMRSKQATVGVLAAIFALLSILVGLSSVYSEYTDLFPLDAGIHVGSLGLGFYIWVSSLVALLLAAIVNSLERK